MAGRKQLSTSLGADGDMRRCSGRWSINYGWSRLKLAPCLVTRGPLLVASSGSQPSVPGCRAGCSHDARQDTAYWVAHALVDAGTSQGRRAAQGGLL